MNILDRFMVALGFQVDPEGIDKFEQQTHALRSAALRLGSVLTGSAVGVGLFVRKMTESLEDINSFAELNQQSARSIEAMRKAGIDYDISGDAMQEGLGSLNRKLGEAAAGIGRGVVLFKKLGLSARDSSGHVLSLGDMLDQVAGKMQGKSRAENIAIAERLGLDPHMVLMLEQGADKVHKLRAEMEDTIPFTAEDYERADKLDKLFIKAQAAAGMLGKVIAVKLMPWVEKALKYFLEWFKGMRTDSVNKITRSFDLLANVFGTLWDWLVRIADGATRAAKWLGQFKVVTYGAGAAVGILVTYKIGAFFITLASALGTAAKAMFTFNAASAGPIILVGALIAAVALLVDDLWNYYHGNESLVGQLREKFPWAVGIAWTALGLLGAAFVALKWQAISSMYETIAIMAMYAAEWAATAASAIAGAVEIGISVVSLAAGWVASFISMTIASIGLLWPFILIGLALVGLVFGIYELWKHWDKVTAFMKKAWHWVVEEIKAGVRWLINTIIELELKLYNLARKIPGMSRLLPKIEFEGATEGWGMAGKVTVGGGVIGRAGNTYSPSSSQTSTAITAPITVISSDPDRAGADIQKTLNKIRRENVRNGQSAVAY